jgi:hypothetical protein
LAINTLYRYIMEVIEIKTLVDITNTDVRRINQGTQQELDQYRNWTTLLQCIGLRAIIEYDRNPRESVEDVKGLGFGSQYAGKQKVWTFQFRPDRSEAFGDKDNPIFLLKQDLDKIPVILNLTETINTQQAVFDLADEKRANTVVKAL